jgi:hypothetical protein
MSIDMSTIKHDMIAMHEPFTDYIVDKGDLPNLPFRWLIVGPSQFSGKTTVIANMLLRPYDNTDSAGKDYYKDNFKGENLYIITPSADIDHKWKKLIEYKKIPPENVFSSYEEDDLKGIQERVEEKFKEAVAEGEKPEHSLVILDDCSFDGSLKKKVCGAISKLFCNSRHILLSSILTSQKYSDIPTTCRVNSTAMILFELTEPEIEQLRKDVGLTSLKEFTSMIETLTDQPHSFMVVNRKFKRADRFQDQYFRPYRK